MNCRWILPFLVLLAGSLDSVAAPIDRIWLGYSQSTPEKITISWLAEESGESRVEFGPTAALGQRAEAARDGRLHHATIPAAGNGPLHYRVRTGEAASPLHQLRESPQEEFRVAVIADAGYARRSWAAAIEKELPHLVITAGDNVAALHTDGQNADREDFSAFEKLIAAAPELFATTPFLPALGNHDREIRARGAKPPADAVYDIEARAFRRFFTLPGREWIWTFAIPQFGVRFAAVDLNHVGDIGTTWQTCNPFDGASEQLAWYRALIEESRDAFLITIYNEQNSRTRGLAAGEWGRLVSRGTLAITGFGYFGERANVDGFTYYNTSVSGTGSRYPDPKSVILHSKDNYLLLRIRKKPASLIVEMKDLDGAVLDCGDFQPRSFPANN